ncbi:hypothetical protein SAMN05444722_0305 [Rhodovulum sp. ES.010]|uniref:hypothetical protein n=1 Tax=Rhodovulum sp. ES.010 TaxID=1882821 RepID=UPI000927B1BB|nr:hypothetical protein [Rhodovulum sp. ES.010]SIO06962.1 hypothetical protein SAMN05444722_0305 [Rhodovulum sp. ES.010]
MSPGPEFFGRGGRIALFALAAYLLVLSGLLIGPAVPLLAIVAVAVAALSVSALRHPGTVRHWAARLARLVRRESRDTGPEPTVPPQPRRPRSTLAATGPSSFERRGLTEGSPLLRLLLGRNWQNREAMVRDFTVLGAGGLVLVLIGLVLPDWPLLGWLGEVLSILGVMGILIATAVLYSSWRDRA